ncbi:MAG: hypothetical protein D3917_14845 [Candidatus Electrothrix sp. AX5]|nr:hypothetical protein [Candidatus Electrothrix sp. AX5]
MAHLSFGIDISEDLLSGVAVARNGKEAKAVSCAFCRLDEDNKLAEQLPLLLEELQWPQKGHCDVGLALSDLSLRNITLPFVDNKKIDQILPFELDEQLLLPIDQQIIATSATMVNKEKGKTHLITFFLLSIFQRHVKITPVFLLLRHGFIGIFPGQFCVLLFP